MKYKKIYASTTIFFNFKIYAIRKLYLWNKYSKSIYCSFYTKIYKWVRDKLYETYTPCQKFSNVEVNVTRLLEKITTEFLISVELNAFHYQHQWLMIMKWQVRSKFERQLHKGVQMYTCMSKNTFQEMKYCCNAVWLFF